MTVLKNTNRRLTKINDFMNCIIAPAIWDRLCAASLETVSLKSKMMTIKARNMPDKLEISPTPENNAIQAADIFFAALVGYFVIGGVMRGGIAAAFGALQVPHRDMGYMAVPAVACIASAMICAGLLFVFAQPMVDGFVCLAAFLDVRIISAGVFWFIIGLLFLFTGWPGAVVCAMGLAIWFLTKWLEVRFSLMMGFFLLPITVYAWIPRSGKKLPWLIKGWGADVSASVVVPSLQMIVANIGLALLLLIGAAFILRLINKPKVSLIGVRGTCHLFRSDMGWMRGISRFLCE